MKIPDKIFIFEEDLQREDHIVMYGVGQDKCVKGLVEYTRTDAFIEKACKFINKANLYLYYCIRLECDLVDTDKFIEDFKKYMEE